MYLEQLTAKVEDKDFVNLEIIYFLGWGTPKLLADISRVCSYTFICGVTFEFLRRSPEPQNTSLSCVLIHEIVLGEIHFPISVSSVQACHRGINTFNISLKEIFMQLGTQRNGAVISALVF